MLIKMLFMALLAYLAVRAVLNLIRVIVRDKDGPATLRPHDRSAPLNGAMRPPSREGRRVPKPDVEDATWIDVD